jgi:tRNA A-37 threonylcarbamoyl transferase component Bud32
MSGSGSSEDERLVPRLLRDLSEHERTRSAVPGAGSGVPAEPPKLSRFEIQGVLGQGATAVVYRARDRTLNRTVAVKLLRDGAGLNDVVRERFRREAQAAAGLAHANVVTVFDAAEEEGRPFLVMELVEGRPLDALLKDPATPKGSLLALLEKAARGVAAAHERGIVHRDLKPANILVASTGEPKVGDFGLAHVLETRTELTRTGTALGTPLYMAPEQVEARSGEISPRTDVYALGAILYEMLAGQPPHVAPSLADLYARIVRQDPVPPRAIKPEIAPDAQTIALKALEKEPSRRYADAREFADDLQRHLRGEPIEARPVGALGRIARRCRRNPLGTAIGAVAFASLLLAGLLGLRMKREIDRLASLAPDPRPWTPVFDGKSLACFMQREVKDWRLENGMLVNVAPRPQALQTERLFEDGEVRVRFECHEQSYLGFNIRLSTAPGYGVEWDRGGVNQMAGAEHVLLFTLRGDLVRATLDGRPLGVKIHSRSPKGTLHFSNVGGTLRIRSIDFREAK